MITKSLLKTFVLSMFLSVAATVASAQNVTGRVVDNENRPIDYVNVLLLKSDSTYIVGTLTDTDGVFTFENPQGNPAFISLSSIGYLTKTLSIPHGGDFGLITLTPESLMLEEVVVKSQRPVTAIKGDALVTNVAGSQLEHAGTANDVLAQVPMMLGRDGNFEVFGKGTPAIYVNGREIHDLTELSRLNSADIRYVEVITNPGAKYGGSVKSVVRIRTKRPQGDGFSETLRIQGVVQKYLRTVDQANIKFRTGGLELFGNFGYLGGKFPGGNRVDMTTRSATLWNQLLTQKGSTSIDDVYAKAGFSYLFNDSHSVGAYYSEGFTKQRGANTGISSISADGKPYDELTMLGRSRTDALPKHHANLYYNGEVGKLGVDFNVDYMWRKSSNLMWNDERSSAGPNTSVSSTGINRSRMIAEKLVFSWPFWKGGIEFGEEYIASRFSTDYVTDAAIVDDGESKVDENNIAGFAEIGQSFGQFNVGIGLRYEHVRFDYSENGQRRDAQSKAYNNLFPSFQLSTMLGSMQLSLNYTHKTRRPGYADLDGTVDYINRFTLEGGNPYLKPEKIHSVELTGSWRQFFGQLSYTYKKDAIMNTTRPYGEDGEVKFITMDNFPGQRALRAFVGGRFQVGVWQPVVNLGLVSQSLTIDYDNGRKKLNNPVGLVQFQNAVHLPWDVWLNVDMQWMSAGNDDNTYQGASSYLNMKLYKAFCNNRFSVTIEANDIFNGSNRDMTLLNKDVTICKVNTTNNRSFFLTLQYSFNTTRDRYRGHGAGANEMNRF